MKKYSKPQRMISVFMIFAIITELTGCAGYRIVPVTSLPDYSIYTHIVFGKNSNYILDGTTLSNGILSGTTDLKKTTAKNAIHVYPLSAEEIKIDSLHILTLPLDRIEKVKAPGIYIPKEYVYSNATNKHGREKVPAGKTALKSLYYISGLLVTSSLAWYIFEKKRR